MIVTAEKPLEEVLGFLASYRRILVLGCQGCFQPPRGLKEAEAYLPRLEAAGKAARAATLARQCDSKIVAKLGEHLGEAEAILSLGCGVGVQVLSEAFPQVPVFPAQNTMFIGGEGEGGELLELCRACGDCLLDRTGGICPITRCPKSLLNGPCGGSQGGKCEVDPKLECAWHLIYERLRTLGRVGALAEIWGVRDWSGRPASSSPARVARGRSAPPGSQGQGVD
ncbi:MAG: methylenetetrahydrofolate reductase C-terminal domain-containing protein [Candidatus Bipolaricaulia bacterium]